MFTSVIARGALTERLDPPYYAPLPLEVDQWLRSRSNAEVQQLGEIGEVIASAFYEGLADRYLPDGAVPLVRVGDVRHGTLDLSGAVTLSTDVAFNTPGLASVACPVVLLTKGGSVGRPGVAFQVDSIALSRDVLGIIAKSSTYVPILLFYLASPPGKAQVLRGASRQVQAHLTVERVKEVIVPKLATRGRARLHSAYENLLNARRTYESAHERMRAHISSIDPFVGSVSNGLSAYTVLRTDELRKRMDVAHYRPGDAGARETAIRQGWRRIGDLPEARLNGTVWNREDYEADDVVDYVALASVEGRTGRVTRKQSLRVWELPSRAKWLCEQDSVLVPSLLESLDRVAVVGAKDAYAIASSGFYVLKLPDAARGRFVAAYLTTVGAHAQIMRAGTGVRFRAYSKDELADLLVPPITEEATIAELFNDVSMAAARLQATWADGIGTMNSVMGWVSSGSISSDGDDLLDLDSEVVE